MQNYFFIRCSTSQLFSLEQMLHILQLGTAGSQVLLLLLAMVTVVLVLPFSALLTVDVEERRVEVLLPRHERGFLLQRGRL